jgi:hypothetical protein
MSIISTSANYGGRINDSQQNIKQFIVSSTSQVIWICKRLTNGLFVQTPANQKYPVLINSDLILTGSLYNTSDERLKQNIKEITQDKIDDLFTLNPIIFNYKNDKTNKIHYGVLAQDVEKVFPELVEHYGVLAQDVEEVIPELVEDNMSRYKTVNYQELLPLMLAKIKNMQLQIDELKQSKNI